MSIILPAIISSGMVLEKRARIWGYCDDADKVCIRFNGREFCADVIQNTWEVYIESDCMGGPFQMQIGDIVLENIYVGYVFCMSGQSNMELPISRVRIRYEDVLKQVDNPLIRAFYVNKEYDFTKPKGLFVGEWKEANAENIDAFFAAPYFFAEKLLRDGLNVPIGLINSAAGGSRIEAWMKEDSLKEFDYAIEALRIYQQDGYVEDVTKRDEQRRKAWHEQLDAHDLGIEGQFQSSSYDDSAWPKRELTKSWTEDIGPINGSVWFRKTVALGPHQAGKPARLFLGRIVDSDYAYVNGEQVGRIEYQYPPRIYPVREGLLKEGENTIAVRVISERGLGGFIKGKDYQLEIGPEKIDLDGEWAYHMGYEMPTLEPAAFFFRYPCGLYNAMLYPVLPYSISAFLWYQGEANTEDPFNYSRLLDIFLRDIRASYGDDLPFLVVQLPNYDAGENNANWQILREQQATILRHHNTALIIANDIGEDNDLHPLNKKDIGERLAIGVQSLLWDIPIASDKVIVNR